MGAETQASPDARERLAPVVETAGRVERDRRPVLALAGVVLGSFVLYTWLASLVDVPRVHPDEVRYLIAASSLVEGEGLSLRGEEYGFGPLYALVLAAILSVTSGIDAAYDLFKAANALLFALTLMVAGPFVFLCWLPLLLDAPPLWLLTLPLAAVGAGAVYAMLVGGAERLLRRREPELLERILTEE